MQLLNAALLPMDMSVLVVITLVVAAACTSAITAALGIGGGVMLMAYWQ